MVRGTCLADRLRNLDYGKKKISARALGGWCDDDDLFCRLVAFQRQVVGRACSGF